MERQNWNTLGQYRLLSPEEFILIARTQRESIILDVRTALEYEEGHLQNARNLDVTSEDFTMVSDHLKTNNPILLYCQNGKRSIVAAQHLANQGISSIVLRFGLSSLKSTVLHKSM